MGDYVPASSEIPGEADKGILVEERVSSISYDIRLRILTGEQFVSSDENALRPAVDNKLLRYFVKARLLYRSID